MAERPAIVGTDAVLNYWDEVNDGCPYFSVWYNSREKATQYDGTDVDTAREKLAKWLQVNNFNGDTSLYYLRIQSEPEKAYKWNSPMIQAIPFRFTALPMYGGTMGGVDYGVMGAIQRMQSTFEERFKALEAAEPADDDKMWNRIGQIIDNPNIGPVIANVMGQLIAKVTNQPFQQSRVAINGVPAAPAASQQFASTAAQTPGSTSQQNAMQPGNEQEQYLARVEAALVRLQEHCKLADDLELLAAMAEQNPGQFKMLLGMLRS